MDLYYILAGASVGFIIGLTGVGGGSLMTPLLVLGFNVQPAIAVGTDLLYAAITKAGGVWSHQKLKNIDWTITKNLCLGSIPGSLACILVIQQLDITGKTVENIISITLGLMLILTSAVIIFKDSISKAIIREHNFVPSTYLIIGLGVILGILVTISSVGAGAIGSALLLILYPSLRARKIVGTDIAHAVPLTAIAGLGHLQLGHVDFNLLFSLLLGSLPAIYLGSILGENIPEKLLKYTIAAILMIIGLRFSMI